jgi:hypothetical protein
MKFIHIPEVHVPGKRLGRHVYRPSFGVRKAVPVSPDLKTTFHTRLVPVFDQGDLGSCTGNAAEGAISTAPFSYKGDEAGAVKTYSLATELDDIPGSYPPDDTGSSGWAAMRALYKQGLIKGWYQTSTLADTLWALQLRPGITGITWLTGCDNPSPSGLVSYSGTVRGGHEIEMYGLDVTSKLIWFYNSWGTSWGLNGTFCMTWSDYEKALLDSGDATFPC